MSNLAADSRLLISPVRFYHNSVGFNYGSKPWRSAIRHSLAYWPKLVLPTFTDPVNENFFEAYLPGELEYLREQDQIEIVASRSRPGDKGLEALRRDTQAYANSGGSSHNKVLFVRQPDSQNDEGFIENFYGQDLSQMQARVAVEVELTAYLPSPSEAVTLQDIIAFKRSRSDELNLLRDKLDSLGFLFARAGQFQEGVNLARRELQPIISELERARPSNWSNRTLVRLRQHLGSFAQNALGGAIAGSVLGEPVKAALITAGGGEIVAYAKRLIVKDSEADTMKPFAYSLQLVKM